LDYINPGYAWRQLDKLRKVMFGARQDKTRQDKTNANINIKTKTKTKAKTKKRRDKRTPEKDKGKTYARQRQGNTF
jgi:hypothetical protein